MINSKLFRSAMRILVCTVALSGIIFTPAFLLLGLITDNTALVNCAALGWLQVCFFIVDGASENMAFWEDQ